MSPSQDVGDLGFKHRRLLTIILPLKLEIFSNAGKVDFIIFTSIVIQWTLEQHGVELHRSTYVDFFQ